MTRILIADDHAVVRQGVRCLLEEHPGWVVCGEAGTGREAVTRTQELRPDVLILDFAMPELNGLEVTRRVRVLVPKTEILVLTMYDSEQVAREVLAAGAHGFVLKSDAGQTLIAAVQTLSQHRSYLTAKLLRAGVVASTPTASDTARGATRGRLTRREREILQLIAEGRTSREIAKALEICVNTADTHRVNLMRKLDLHSVSELVRYAIRNQMIQP
jgi:DNA-binding NarL/FixJ family response regulator